MFQQFLGRNPTASESQYFSGLIEKGELQPMEISYFLQGTPEYQENKSAESRQAAMASAEQYDKEMFPQYAQQIGDSFAQKGRADTSGYDVAMAQLTTDLARERGQEFSGMTREDAMRNLGYGAQRGYGAIQNQYGQQSATTAFGRQESLMQQQYENQRNLMGYQNELNKKNQPSFLQSLVPGAIQAAGAIYGGKLSRPIQ